MVDGGIGNLMKSRGEGAASLIDPDPVQLLRRLRRSVRLAGDGGALELAVVMVGDWASTVSWSNGYG